MDRVIATAAFQSTRPIRGATLSCFDLLFDLLPFQSTRPIRGATIDVLGNIIRSIFQSTRPIRGATWLLLVVWPGRQDFNPRAPYGARRNTMDRVIATAAFQSTRPIRGATLSCFDLLFDLLPFQSTRPIRGATIDVLGNIIRSIFQSTRPIRGATWLLLVVWPGRQDFNPRAPYGARQKQEKRNTKRGKISIHAPHTGRDQYGIPNMLGILDFNPRAPYGARHHPHNTQHDKRVNFNPRAPYGARPAKDTDATANQQISIHAPHTGRDLNPYKLIFVFGKFQSTRPIRGATCIRLRKLRPALIFQSTRPIRGATRITANIAKIAINFNPRAPYGARQQKCIIYVLHFCNNRQSKHKNQQETSSVRTFF